MKILIKRVTENNYKQFTKLIEYRRIGKDTLDLSYYENQDMIKFMNEYHILDSKTFFIYAAEVNQTFVGYINAVLIPKPDPRKGMLFVDELWTLPEYRREGIASQLMKEVFKKAKELNLWRVRLYVGEDNPVARNFYKKMGFQETDLCETCEVNISDIIL